MTRLIVDIPPEKMNAAIRVLIQKGIVNDHEKITLAPGLEGFSYYVLLHRLKNTNSKRNPNMLYYCFSDWDIFCNELEFE